MPRTQGSATTLAWQQGPRLGGTGAGVALPHLHLHAQAVEEMSREGQAVHRCERGVNPAWRGRDVASPSARSQAGLTAAAWPDPGQHELGIFQPALVPPSTLAGCPHTPFPPCDGWLGPPSRRACVHAGIPAWHQPWN